MNVLKWFFGGLMVLIFIAGVLVVLSFDAGKKMLPQTMDNVTNIEVTVKSFEHSTNAAIIGAEEYPDSKFVLMLPQTVEVDMNTAPKPEDKITLSIKKDTVPAADKAQNIVSFGLTLADGTKWLDPTKLVNPTSHEAMGIASRIGYGMCIVPGIYFACLLLFASLRRKAA